VKYVLLELLQERPMHGYEMIKALEEKSGGFYTPSPGSVYPTLQMLEEGGYVTASESEGKKVYTITDAGRALLAERKQGEEHWGGPPWMRGRHREGQEGHAWRGPRPEVHALRTEAMEVARLFAIAGRKSIQDPEQLAQLRAIIERTRTDLQAFIYGDAAGRPAPTQAEQAQAPTVEEA
jgi:DNA-binding PadR family transcriptional regulator